MKFVIGANNLKIFCKSINALAKIGDEIYVEPLNDTFSLRTVNSSRSAFVCYSFNKKFFTHFDSTLKNKFDETINRTTANDDDDDIVEVETFRCKIPSKCLMYIFKNISSIEKNVEKCTITVKYIPLEKGDETKVYDYDATMMKKFRNKENEELVYETKFLVIMSCKYGLRKTYILSISDCENLQAVFSSQNCPNRLNISAKYINETMNSFSNDIEEITFIVKEDQLAIKNYVDASNAKSIVNTQVTYEKDEFESYEIESETDITFCLKEFKVCLLFGSVFDLSLAVIYERKGRPIIFQYDVNEMFEVNYTLATLNEDSCTQMTTQNSSQQSIIINNTTLLETTTTAAAGKAANSSLIASRANTASQRSQNVTMQKNEVPKNNKRTLYDASNDQSYLNESIDNISLHDAGRKRTSAAATGGTSQDTNSDSSDMSSRYNNLELVNDVTNKLPPPKKLKSILDTFFEEDNDENESVRIDEKTLDATGNKSIYIDETSSSESEND